MIPRIRVILTWILIGILTGLFIYIAVVKLASLTHASEAQEILSKIEQVFDGAKSYELVAEFQDGKVQLYRVVYTRDTGTQEICYVAIGYLHGYTIALDCRP